MRRIPWHLAILLALVGCSSPALAGKNQDGAAFLTWDQAGRLATRSDAPEGPFPLYLQLRNAPDIRALAVHITWYPRDPTRACYELITGTGPAPSAPPDSLYGWATAVPPGTAFAGDTLYGWTISFKSRSARKDCVAYLVTGSACDTVTRAVFRASRVMTMDSGGAIDTLKTLGDAEIIARSDLGIAPTVGRVYPSALPRGDPTDIEILGGGFQPGSRVFLESSGQRIEASSVAFADSSRLRGQVTSRFPDGAAIDVAVRIPSGAEGVGRALLRGASGMSSPQSSTCLRMPSNNAYPFRYVSLYFNREATNVVDHVNHPEWPSWLDNYLLVIRSATGDTVAVMNSSAHDGLGFHAPHPDTTSRVRFFFDPPTYATSIATLVTSGRTYKDLEGEFADGDKPLLRMKASYVGGDTVVTMLRIGTHVRNWVSGSSECNGTHEFYDSAPSDSLFAEILTDPTYHYDLQEWRLPADKRTKRVESLEFIAQPVNRTECTPFYGTSELCGVAVWPKFQVENPAGEQVPLIAQNDDRWRTTPYGGFYRNGVLHGTRRTIAANGCNLTRYTMVHNFLGTTVTPPELNSFLQQKGDGYAPEIFARVSAIAGSTLQYALAGTAGRPVGDTVFVLSRGRAKPIAAAVVRAASTAEVVEVFEPGLPISVGAPVATYGLVNAYWAAEGFPGSTWRLMPLRRYGLAAAMAESTLCDSMPVILHVKDATHFILATGWAPAFVDTNLARGTYLVNDPRWPVTRLVQDRYSNVFCEARACKRLPAAQAPLRARTGSRGSAAAGRMLLFIRSDSRLYLEDPLGRLVQYDEDTGQYANDVPDLVALREEVVDDDDDSTLVSDPVDLFAFSAPLDGEYQLTVQADADGDVDVFAAAYDDTGGVEGNVDLVSLTAGSQARYRLTYSSVGGPTATLQLLGVVDVPIVQSASPRLALRTIGNPGIGAASFICEGGAGPLLACEIFDIRGRRVRRLEAAALGSGPIRIRWDGRNEQGTVLAPGVYLVKVRRELEVAGARIVLLR